MSGGVETEPVKRVSLATRLKKLCPHEYDFPVQQNTNEKKMPFAERVERARPYAWYMNRGSEPEPLKEDKKATLKNRLEKIKPDTPGRYQKAIKNTVPLEIRLAPAAKGCFLDPFALIDMFRCSCEHLVEWILQEDDIRNLRNKWNVSISGNKLATYQDAAVMIRDALMPQEGEDAEFSIALMPDDEYEVMIAIAQSYIKEVQRRNQKKLKNTAAIASEHPFPAFDMPLPQLFQAATECCHDEDKKKYFRTLYEQKYKDLLTENEKVKHYVRSIHSYQPVRDSSYCDVASAANGIMFAEKESFITIDEAMSLLYEMLFTPFLTDKNPTQKTSGRC